MLSNEWLFFSSLFATCFGKNTNFFLSNNTSSFGVTFSNWVAGERKRNWKKEERIKQKPKISEAVTLANLLIIKVRQKINFQSDLIFGGNSRDLLSPVPSGRLVKTSSSRILVGIFHDLCLQMILVRQDIALPLRHLLLFANPDLVGNLKKV